MLNIPSPKKEKIEEYYNDIKERIHKELNESLLSDDIKSFLSINKIKHVIIDEPQKLIVHHNDFMSRFVDIEANTQEMKKEISKQVKSVFNYEEIISRSKKTSYDLAKITNRNTCTYCNRLYTNTIEEKDPVTRRFNDNYRITRPVFDHWYCKAKYPLLALSFYNLIPSCSVCNSSIKGSDEFSLESHLHPYIDNAINDFSFSYQSKALSKNEVTIKYKTKNDKLKKTLEDFKTKEVYNAHSNLELEDLIDLNKKYNDNYIDTLFNNTFSNLNMKEPEIYRLIFGIESQESDFYKRPFSKFKKDIIEELREKMKNK